MANPLKVVSMTAAEARLENKRGRPVIGQRMVGAAAGLALAALVAPAIVEPHLRLVWNVSASVPLGLYRIEPSVRPHVGELAAVRPPVPLARLMANRRYVEQGALLVKPVAATSGAQVCRRGDIVSVAGVQVAMALDRDRFGRDLPRWSGCRRLGAGDYFLLAPGVRASFDSRYFGPVSGGAVLGRATSLWVAS